MPTTAAAPAVSTPEDDIPPTAVQHQIALAKTTRAKAASNAAAHLVAAAAALDALAQSCIACGESASTFAQLAIEQRTMAKRVARRYA